MFRMTRLLIIAVLGTVIMACVSHTTLVPQYTNDSSYSVSNIERAILAYNGSRGWSLKKVRNGEIQGKLVNRGHTATVRIPYSASGYKIELVDSNLMQEDGTIHRNYNRWVANLNNGIQANLLRY